MAEVSFNASTVIVLAVLLFLVALSARRLIKHGTCDCGKKCPAKQAGAAAGAPGAAGVGTCNCSASSCAGCSVFNLTLTEPVAEKNATGVALTEQGGADVVGASAEGAAEHTQQPKNSGSCCCH